MITVYTLRTGNGKYIKTNKNKLHWPTSSIKTRSLADRFLSEAEAYAREATLRGLDYGVITVEAYKILDSSSVSRPATPLARTAIAASEAGMGKAQEAVLNVRIWGWFDAPTSGVEHRGVKCPPRVAVTSDTGMSMLAAWRLISREIGCTDEIPFSVSTLTGADAEEYIKTVRLPVRKLTA